MLREVSNFLQFSLKNPNQKFTRLDFDAVELETTQIYQPKNAIKDIFSCRVVELDIHQIIGMVDFL